MSRIKLRVPGRYERPAELRGPLGNSREARYTEAGIRGGYAAGVRARMAVRAAAAAGELAEPDESSPVAEASGPRTATAARTAVAGGR